MNLTPFQGAPTGYVTFRYAISASKVTYLPASFPAGSGTVTAPLLPAGASRTSVQTPSAPFFKEAQGLFRTASRISGRVKSHSQTGAAAAGSRQAPARRKSNSL